MKKVKKEKLHFEYDSLPITMALDILLNLESRVYKAKFKIDLNDLFSFNNLFYHDEKEYDIVRTLTNFVEDGLIEELVISLYQADGPIDRELISTTSFTKEDLGSIDPIGLITKPFLSPKDLKDADELDRYYNYELRPDLNKIRKWLDHRLELLKGNKFMHQALRYEKQKALVIKDIEAKLIDYVPQNLRIAQFETIDKLLYPLIIYDLYKEKYLDIKLIKVLKSTKSGNDVFLFEVDILKDADPKCINSNITFDEDSSILKIKDLVLRLIYPSQQHRLLKTVFSDLGKTWDLHDINLIYDPNEDYEPKRWCDVAYAINNKVYKGSKGKYDEFLDANTFKVRVNPIYL